MSCFATTNKVFWEKWEHWKIPCWVPYFTSRSAVTHELFDLITEFRPSMTAAGIEEHIRQLHLLEYHVQQLEYVTAFGARSAQTLISNPLENFSSYDDPNAYDETSITHDMVTCIYLEFSSKTRQKECTDYLKTRTGIVISLDNTFKSSGKVLVVEKDKSRVKLMKGGVLSVLNELNDIISWVRS
ncbi:hypothetical protein CVT26_011237 [Gymnopilus dilepis]|uniref:Uncharacterized protein n=1 Tax=Gymnopilus dilepis TaxID=231916 RepID=A0A409X0L1_9AGAR|nr:hypothetical protein CVT26_011237 [Gymnopilus dilepis]